jgi:1-acyl-sn-glycerol-3-phosphate acyltransferase
LGPFKNAPFGLAIAARVPLVPVYVHATFRILPKGAWRLRPRPIRLLVGDPIPTAGLTLDDRESLQQRARAAIVALRARVDGAPSAP